MTFRMLTPRALFPLLIAALACPSPLTAQKRPSHEMLQTETWPAMQSPAQTEEQRRIVKFTTLVNFDYTNGGNPAGPLIKGRGHNFYGTTFDGGSNTNSICFGTCGTFFKISPRGKLTTLYNFCSEANCTDGVFPAGPLVLGVDGSFYGITESGGANGSGTVFRITPTGTLTTIYNWCSQANCADGFYGFFPEADSLIQAADGIFYGTNDVGGNATLSGTLFKLTPDGTLTTLYTFCSQTNCADGSLPTGLIQATDGNFYGTTLFGGAHGDGTVFKISRSGALTTLYNFCSQTNFTDGALPFGPMIQAGDGNLYGTASAGGTSTNPLCGGTGCGTVFKINSQGLLTTLYSFCSRPNCADGASPDFSLVHAHDGSFYGSTVGANCAGCNQGITIFKLSRAGKLTTLHTFHGVFQNPEALVQGTNGTFYGVTLEGGKYNSCVGLYCGTVFRLAVCGDELDDCEDRVGLGNARGTVLAP